MIKSNWTSHRVIVKWEGWQQDQAASEGSWVQSNQWQHEKCSLPQTERTTLANWGVIGQQKKRNYFQRFMMVALAFSHFAPCFLSRRAHVGCSVAAHRKPPACCELQLLFSLLLQSLFLHYAKKCNNNNSALDWFLISLRFPSGFFPKGDFYNLERGLSNDLFHSLQGFHQSESIMKKLLHLVWNTILESTAMPEMNKRHDRKIKH